MPTQKRLVGGSLVEFARKNPDTAGKYHLWRKRADGTVYEEIEPRIKTPTPLAWTTLTDSFTASAGTLAGASAPTGQTYSVLTGSGGTWSYVGDGTAKTGGSATANETLLVAAAAGAGDCVHTLNFHGSSTRFEVGVAFALNDVNNFLFASLRKTSSVDAINIGKRVAGTYTTLATIASSAGLTLGADYTLKVEYRQGSIMLWVNGVRRLAFTLAGADQTTFSAYTGQAVRIYRAATSDDGTSYVQDWSVTSLTPDFPRVKVTPADLTSALPVGWVWDNTGADTAPSYSITSLGLQITIPNTTVHDTLNTAPNYLDTSVGLKTLIGDIDFDIAVQMATDIRGKKGRGMAFIVEGPSPGSMLRMTIYGKVGPNGGYNNLAVFRYAAYMNGTNTITLNSGSNVQDGTFYSGGPAWYRLKRVKSTNTYTFYYSSDSVNWTLLETVTAATWAVKSVKIGITSSNPAQTNVVTIKQIVDYSKVTDPRPPWVKTTHTNVQTTDFSSGALPSWLTAYTANGGTATVTGSPLRLQLAHTANVNQSYATVAYNGTATMNQGLLVKVQAAGTINGIPYFDPGIIAHGAEKDQYSPAGGSAYIIELPMSAGAKLRIVRRTQREEPNDLTLPNGFESAYTHLLIPGSNFVPGTTIWWLRIEYADGRYRANYWQDGSSEPGTWYYDGADTISADAAGVQTLNWAHNDSVSVSATTDTCNVYYVERYDLT